MGFPAPALGLLVALASAGLLAAPAALASGGGEIRGTVTSVATTAPLQGVEVCAEGEGELPGGCAQTGAEGEYAIGELAEGTYTVLFNRLETGGFEYLAEYFSGTASRAEATPVLVSAEGATIGVDAALARRKLPAAPVAETGSASAITATGATLNAGVNPDGAEVLECELEYGTTAAYGASEPCPSAPGSGTSVVPETLPVHGLAADTEYHFRVRARNELGSGFGEDGTFRTLPNRPVVSAIAPDAGLQAGGTIVSITGSELAAVTGVLFGSAPATRFTVVSPTEITAESPPGTGTVQVTVSDSGGTSATSHADEFGYVPPGAPPTVTKLSSKKGVAAGGTGVIINGTNFVGVTGISFGSTPASSFKVETDTSISVVSPPGTTGSVSIIVTTPNGANSPSSKDMFGYGSPTVTGLSPASGPAAGGTAVTVTGSGFAVGGGRTAFELGKLGAVEVSCSSSSQCTFLTPPSSKPTTVDVRAVVSAKTSAKNPPMDQFTYR